MAASAQGPPPLPKETHRYRIALPGLTGQNSPTIGGEGRKGRGRGEGGRRNFRSGAARLRCGGGHERRACTRERRGPRVPIPLINRRHFFYPFAKGWRSRGKISKFFPPPTIDLNSKYKGEKKSGRVGRSLI